MKAFEMYETKERTVTLYDNLHIGEKTFTVSLTTKYGYKDETKTYKTLKEAKKKFSEYKESPLVKA